MAEHGTSEGLLAAFDKSVLTLFEVVALLFALPFGEDLYHSTPATEEHWHYLYVGLGFAVAGPLVSYIFRQASSRLSSTIRAASENFYVWLVLILLIFVYGIGSDLYWHVTTTPLEAQKTTLVGWLRQAQQGRDHALTTVVEIEQLKQERDQLKQQLAAAQSQLQDYQRQLSAAQQAAHTSTAPPPPEDQIPISWQPDFQFNWYGTQKPDAGPRMAWIRFNGHATALAHIKDAYIISSLTGHKEQLDVANPANFSDKWNFDQIEPITTGAQVTLIHEWQPPLLVAEFLSQWGAFEFHVVYDAKEYVKSYSQNDVGDKIAREMPGVVGPRVTKKPADK